MKKDYVICEQYATSYGLPFSMNTEIFQAVSDSPCHFCGSIALDGNSVEFFKLRGGYVPSNIYSCCEMCSSIKANMTYDEFNDWLIRIINNQYS